MTQWCLGGGSFFLAIDDVVALGCILSGRCNLRVLFYAQVLCLKNKQRFLEANPLRISYAVLLFGSVVTSSCLPSSFLWVSSSIRSSLVSSSCCIARTSLLQWSHLLADLAWNKDVLLHSIQHCTVKPTNAQPLVQDACMRHCMPQTWAHLSVWTCEHMFASLNVCSFKVRM